MSIAISTSAQADIEGDLNRAATDLLRVDGSPSRDDVFLRWSRYRAAAELAGHGAAVRPPERRPPTLQRIPPRAYFGENLPHGSIEIRRDDDSRSWWKTSQIDAALFVLGAFLGPSRATRLCAAFLKDHGSRLTQPKWTLTADEVRRWAETQEGA